MLLLGARLLLLLPTVVFLLPVTLLAAQIMLGLGAAKPLQDGKQAPPFTVLVPAHNEAEMLGATLDNLVPQLRADDRLLVIADNCTDQTAAIARQRGVEVAERNDPFNRGKGYALDHGLQVSAAHNNSVAIVVDADCTVGPGSLQLLAAQVARTGLPAQAQYDFIAPDRAGPGVRFRTFALRVKNHVRLLGARHLGAPCILTGSGMAFPRDALSKVKVGSPEIVEDMVLGIDLALIGYPARYCPEAWVKSLLPTSQQATESQRERWEGGVMAVARRLAIPLMMRGLRQGNGGLVLLGLDIAIPPLVLLLMALLIASGAAALSGSVWGLSLALGQLGLLVLSLAAAWWRHGRDLLNIGDFPAIVMQVAGKIGFYRRLTRKGQTGWVRTAREITPSEVDRAYAGTLGFHFSHETAGAIKARILHMAHQSYSYVITPNVDFVVRAHDNAAARKLYNAADLQICDSRVLALTLRPFDPALTCLPGSDIVRELIVQQGDLRLMIVGPTEAQIDVLRARYPHCKIDFTATPRSFSPGDAAWQQCLESTATAHWDILLVCLGSPKQEEFAYQLRMLRKRDGVALCVGASIDFLTGHQRRAPEWIQRLAMEWAFRLATNPRRLFRRYLINNPKFFLILFREVWRTRILRSSPHIRNWTDLP